MATKKKSDDVEDVNRLRQQVAALEQLVEAHKQAEFEQAKRLERLFQEVTLQREIAVAANWDYSVEDTLRFALRRICEYTSWTVGHVYFCKEDESGKTAVPTALWHTTQQFPMESFRSISESTSFSQGTGLPGSLLVLAAILSATAREASYCRKDQWKLHRMVLAERRCHRPSVYAIFKRRLQTYLHEASATDRLQGTCDVRLGDARELKESLGSGGLPIQYDLVITSPPYGDSKTTVSYGGMSSICLATVQYLEGLPIGCLTESAIERACLGGDIATFGKRFNERIRKYWTLRTENREQMTRVASYLDDLGKCCKQISQVVKPGGRVIFVVARRMVGGRRVQTDSFLISEFRRLGFSVEKTYSRRIKNKHTPTIIDRNGATRSENSSKRISTMRTEIIIVFRNNSR